MATVNVMKLTPFGKIFVALVIVAVVGFITYRRFGGDLKKWSEDPASKSTAAAGSTA